MARLEDLRPQRSRPPGTRVLIDVRPLQEPERAPITAHYLDRLLRAFTADRLPGESFVPLVRLLRDDPTRELEADGLPVTGRRRLPPTSRTFRSAGLTVDSFLLRGASVGARRVGPPGGGEPTAAMGDRVEMPTVFHTAGGAVPIASGVPVVATVLDLAPWELPDRYAASAAARLGHRLRARSLRDAACVICCSGATAESARRLLHLASVRVAVVPLAADAVFTPGAADPALISSLRARFDLPERFLVFAGRYDARKDFGTLFAALAALRQEGAPAARRRRANQPGQESQPWPPVVVLAGAAGVAYGDSAVVGAAARRAGIADQVRLTPDLKPTELAALQAASIGHVQPALSDGTGLAVLGALAVGIPVIASRVGALPELVGTAGIVVEPRDPARLATAIRAIWEGGAVARQVARAAAARADRPRRTWGDVAEETRVVYAKAAVTPVAERETTSGQ
jgi:glycosyltransferase involved in cell wall biosynthesis